jgi:hypothetical protein
VGTNLWSLFRQKQGLDILGKRRVWEWESEWESERVSERVRETTKWTKLTQIKRLGRTLTTDIKDFGKKTKQVKAKMVLHLCHKRPTTCYRVSRQLKQCTLKKWCITYVRTESASVECKLISLQPNSRQSLYLDIRSVISHIAEANTKKLQVKKKVFF